MADTTVRYPGPLDAVEVLIPENARAFDAPRHQVVEAGGTLTTSAEHAQQLVDTGWEPVEPAAAEAETKTKRAKRGGDEQ